MSNPLDLLRKGAAESGPKDKENPLAKLIQGAGISLDTVSRRSNIGQILRGMGVQETADIHRVKALPEVHWQDNIEELEEAGRLLKEQFARQPPDKCEESCVCRGSGDMSLRAIQSAALLDIADYGGLVGALRVGAGKTLLSFLAPHVVGAQRPMLIVPADLKGKTERAFRKLARHWTPPGRYKILSFQKLSRESGLQELVEYMPDLVVADEAQLFKNRKAACTKHFSNYMQLNPDCKYLDMSGTWMSRDIMEIHHRLKWALPKGLHPLPHQYNRAQEWADAVNEQVGITGRIMPGSLKEFYTEEDLEELAKDDSKPSTIKVTRQALRRKIMGAPGIIGTTDSFDSDVSILVRGVTWELSDAVLEAFTRLRKTWESPDGQTIDSPTRLAQYASQLVQGFYYRLDPPPPEEWTEARREWGAMAREVISRGKYYTPMLVANAIDRGDITMGAGELHRWRAIKDTYDPDKHRITTWLCDGAKDFCVKWANKHTGIIWVQEQALGRRLHAEAGIPYYGSQGMCGDKYIEDETGSCVASVAANHKGRNLQYAFHKNLLVTPPHGGQKWEQLVGRTHREGQKADSILVDVGINCYENWATLRQARHDAEFQERISGQEQKLNIADVDCIDAQQAFQLSSKSMAWDKTNADFFEGKRKRWDT